MDKPISEPGDKEVQGLLRTTFTGPIKVGGAGEQEGIGRQVVGPAEFLL